MKSLKIEPQCGPSAVEFCVLGLATMKKILGILVLSFFWSNITFADIDAAKKECKDLGFKPGTENFGECVLKLLPEKKKNKKINKKKPKKKN